MSLSLVVTGVLQLCSQCLQQPSAQVAVLAYPGKSRAVNMCMSICSAHADAHNLCSRRLCAVAVPDSPHHVHQKAAALISPLSHFKCWCLCQP